VGFIGIRVLPPHEVELSVGPISTKPAADRQLYQMRRHMLKNNNNKFGWYPRKRNDVSKNETPT
jgi:hypothetical protein